MGAPLRLRRWAKRLGLAFAVIAGVLTAPIVWIEAGCRSARDAAPGAPPALVSDEPGYARRESDSYLSYPEWHIVYAYEDLAGVLREGDESDFAYGSQIAGFWRSFCALNRVVTARGGTGLDTKVMLYTIGWSFTAELGIKGAYEKTAGRLFEWLRGPGKTGEDAFAARDLAGYAAFLHQTPWYEYPFGARVAAFWREAGWGGGRWLRKLERRAVFTAEYGVKAVYGWLIGRASQTALGAADLEIKTVVTGLAAEDVARDSRIRVVRSLGGGRTLILTPRYQAYTDLVVDLARRGRNVDEIAGNRRIFATVLAFGARPPAVAGMEVLFALPVQSRPGWQRVGLDGAVAGLAAAIRSLEASGAVVEHVYDY